MIAALAAAVIMAGAHLFAGRLRFLSGTPRSRWLSFAGGVSVAYVIVHLIPEIAEYQDPVSRTAVGALVSLERHVYVLALAGLVAFYGVEHASRRAPNRHAENEDSSISAAAVFSFATYAVYNAIIGYLLVRREDGLLLFAAAMGLHFLVNDYGLREHHRGTYDRVGRWMLSAMVILGVAVGYVADVPEGVVGLLVAFIGGGTILNVLKEELPAERESRFGAFVVGVLVYTAVLLAI